MKKWGRPAALAAAAIAAFGCAQQGTDGAKLAEGEKLHITKVVWTDYQTCIQEGRGLGPDRQGAFGVAIIGDIGVVGVYSYRYCPRMYDGCGSGGPTVVTDILDACRRDKVECLIFARNEDIQVPYEIAD